VQRHFAGSIASSPASLAQRKLPGSISASTRYRLGLWGLTAPFLIGAVALIGAPALLTFALAFFEYDALSPPTWRGVQNFTQIFHERVFQIAVWNSAIFVAMAVPLRVMGALGLALLLQHRRRGHGLYRIAVFLPTVVPDIAYALIWLWIFNPLFGPLNLVLGAVGLPQPAWLVDPSTALVSIVIMSLFQIGEGFVLLLAGLRSIPADYYAAGSIYGAGRWQLFRYVTLPLLAPWLVLLTIRDILVTSQNTFTAAYLMTGGGPYYATLFMPLLIYEEAFDRFRFGLGSAMMLTMFLAIGLLLYLVFLTLKGWGYEDDA
jgi:multiple sugar transport system permease protein